MCQEIWVHIFRQCFHHLKCFDASLCVDIWRSGSILKERPTHAKEHVVEFLCQVPTSSICAADWVFHDTLITDHLGCGQHLFVCFWRFNTDLFQHICAVYQMLCVGHKRDGHDFAVNGDQLICLQRLAVLGDQIIQRTNN